jgi:glutathione S-transferase
MSSSSYQLYARQGAGSLALQMLLEEIGSAYELVWVSKAPADIERFRHISSAAKIPVLVLPDGTVMSESAAILIHLTIAHPAAKLAPDPGSSAHAHFLQWMVFLSANVYEAALRYSYPDRYSAAGEAAAAQIKTQALADWGKHFEIIDAALSPYVLGAELSAADHYLHMLAGWYPLDDPSSASRLPKLRQHAELMRRRPATLKAEEDHRDS